MLKQPITIILILLFLPINAAFSQNVKFGKVSKQELEEKFYPLDSTASAAILYNPDPTAWI